jgi:rhamnosyltransferase
MVAPIRAGSGTRLKILEAFAAGLPVASTALGAEGIDCRDGRHLLIADEPAAFARAVGRLLDDGALGARLAGEAVALAAERYDWRHGAAAALACYRELTAAAPAEDTTIAGRVARGAAAPGPAPPPRPRAGAEIAASVVIPTRNGGARLRQALEAIGGQRFAGRFEVVVVDSGSRPGELRALAEFPVRVEAIDPARFNHGLTRDLGAALSRGRVLVFLNQDAVPGDERWLERLTEPLLGVAGRRAAVQGGIREVPDLGERFYWDSCGERFYFTRESRRWLRAHGGIGFSTVNAAIRRDLWERFPFGWAPIMEDKKWQGEVVEAGYRIVTRPRAFVYHTHDYDLPALLRRCGSEGYGWRLLGERYGLGDALRDALTARVYADLARGLGRRRIRSAAEFFFPLLRPLALYHGNRWASAVRL